MSGSGVILACCCKGVCDETSMQAFIDSITEIEFTFTPETNTFLAGRTCGFSPQCDQQSDASTTPTGPRRYPGSTSGVMTPGVFGGFEYDDFVDFGNQVCGTSSGNCQETTRDGFALALTVNGNAMDWSATWRFFGRYPVGTTKYDIETSAQFAPYEVNYGGTVGGGCVDTPQGLIDGLAGTVLEIASVTTE